MDDQDLKAMLEKFEATAKLLQKSLLTRNVAEIWSALDAQETAAQELGTLIGANAETVRGASSRDPVIRRLLDRSQTLLRANRAMATRFLDVIDQTISQLGGRTASSCGYGNIARRSSPLLVRQQG